MIQKYKNFNFKQKQNFKFLESIVPNMFQNDLITSNAMPCHCRYRCKEN